MHNFANEAIHEAGGGGGGGGAGASAGGGAESVEGEAAGSVGGGAGSVLGGASGFESAAFLSLAALESVLAAPFAPFFPPFAFVEPVTKTDYD